MGASRQRLLNGFATIRTLLECVLWLHPYGNTAKNLGIVFDPHPELIQPSIGYGFSQTVITLHVAYLKIFVGHQFEPFSTRACWGMWLKASNKQT